MNTRIDEPIAGDGSRLRDPAASEDSRTLALLIHLALLLHIVAPVVAIVAPIIMWRMHHARSAFLDDHGREATNFQVSLVIYAFALPLAAGLLTALTCGLLFPLVVVAAAVPWILGLIGMIFAAGAAHRGEYYRYPMTLRLIPS